MRKNEAVDTDVPTAGIYLTLRRQPRSWPAAVTAMSAEQDEDTGEEEFERTSETGTESDTEDSTEFYKEPEEYEQTDEPAIFIQSTRLDIEGVRVS